MTAALANEVDVCPAVVEDDSMEVVVDAAAVVLDVGALGEVGVLLNGIVLVPLAQLATTRRPNTAADTC